MLKWLFLLWSMLMTTMVQALTLKQYQALQQPGLDKPQLVLADIAPVLEKHRENPLFNIEQLGQSLQGQPIYQITIGSGDIRLLGWSQMHGDESTATAALMDLLNFIAADEQAAWREKWLNNLSLRFIPMVNPDGASLGVRVNAQGIDINRDAKHLQSPEGRLLMAAAKSFKPHFGLNLHDQNRYYAVGDSEKMATISLLAPAFDHQKTIDESRHKAMQLAAELGQLVERELPGHLGRYNDTYSPRSFGDTFAGMGISTVLFESSTYYGDDNRQQARRINTLMLIAAIESAAGGRYQQIPLSAYEQIPFNRDRGVRDLIISNVKVETEQPATLDISFDFDLNGSRQARINDIGDLSIYGGYHKFDAEGLRYQQGKAYPLTEQLELSDSRYLALLRQGYTHFSGDAALLKNSSTYPVVMNPSRLGKDRPWRGHHATFLLVNPQGQPQKVVLNGQVVDLLDGKVRNPLGA